MGNTGKTTKITVFDRLNPLNSGFDANFAPYPQEADTRDFLGQIWKIKIFVSGRGSKTGLFWPFLSLMDKISTPEDLKHSF